MGRSVAFLILSALLVGLRPTLSGQSIESVAQRFLPEAAFQEISEFLTGTKSDGGRMVIRSVPGSRRGYYWIIRVDKNWEQLPADCTLELRYIRPDDPEVRVLRLDMPATKPPRREFYLGLTGKDWPFDEGVHPTAWQIRIIARDGTTVVTEAESFLWKRPG
ncbi:MAG: hypothetical protein ACFE0O_05265 [Opitutales bacterium]